MKFKLKAFTYYNKSKNKELSIYDNFYKNKDNPLGYCFNISPKDKSIYIIGKYTYLKKKEFEKFIKYLKEVISFYEKELKSVKPRD